jgi:outer membrane protein
MQRAKDVIMKIYTKSLVAAGVLAVIAAPAFAYEPGTFVLRGGVGTVDVKSHVMTFTDDVDTIDVSVENATNMTLTGTYMFNENWALDVLAALPFKHDIRATMDLGEGPQSAKIADTKQLPPTVSVQYHFAPDKTFKPYVGVGLNWTTFFDSKLVSEMQDEETDKLYLDDSFGIAAQIGGDWAIGDRTVVNFDIRWMDIDTDVSIGGPGVPGKVKLGSIEIDPWVYALNLGYQF